MRITECHSHGTQIRTYILQQELNLHSSLKLLDEHRSSPGKLTGYRKVLTLGSKHWPTGPTK